MCGVPGGSEPEQLRRGGDSRLAEPDPERRVPRPFDLNAYGLNPKTEYRDVG